MSFSQKISELLKKNGMTKAVLAKKSGIPYTTLDSMLKRDSDTARLGGIFRIAKALGTSVEELVFDEKQQSDVVLSAEEKRIIDLYSVLDARGKDAVFSLLEAEARHSQKNEKQTDDFWKKIEVYEAPAAAGTGLDVLTEDKIEMLCENVPKGADFGIRISGDSMEPAILNGEVVYVKRNTEIMPGEIGVFLLNGESLCKKLARAGGDMFLISLNPAYTPIHVLETDDLKLVGKVILPEFGENNEVEKKK